MKIKSIDENEIKFDNGNYLTADHEQDCCEHVYADFANMQIKTNVFANSISSDDLDFDEDLYNHITLLKGVGFTITDKNGIELFISCYNSQNGYYSSNLTLLYHTITKPMPMDVYIDISDCTEDDIW